MTILNTIDIFARDNFFDIGLALCCAIGLFICIVGIALDKNLREFSFIACIVGLAISTCCFTIVSIAKPAEYRYTQIECLIDETVTAQDILDNYELIEHRGEIYVLKYIDAEKTEYKGE